MRSLVLAFIVAAFSFSMSACGPKYVQVGAAVGPAPACPYGYFDAAPYDCAPFGYYGPEWFVGGTFLGAGPWFQGNRGFRGSVDNRFHPEHGYRGALPARGTRAETGATAAVTSSAIGDSAILLG